jgi:ParB family chromosome partitioning protein
MSLSDREAFEISITENVQRNSLNPIEEAEAFRKYVDDFGYGGVSELAAKIGKSQEFVSRRLQLLLLPKRIQKEIIRRRINASTAYELCGLDSSYSERVAEEILRDGLSLREVRRAVRRYREVQRIESELVPFMACVEGDRRLSLEERERRIERGLKQCIASLKASMSEFDQAVGRLGDEWVVREILMQQRTMLHQQIDSLLQIRSKIRRSAYLERLIPN